MKDILYEGKSKIVYSGEDNESLLIKFKDTATAFNGKKKEELMEKGQLNAEISNIIFNYLSKNGIKTHLLKVIDERSVLVKKQKLLWLRLL